MRYWNKKYFRTWAEDMPLSSVTVGSDIDRTGKGRTTADITVTGSIDSSLEYFWTANSITRKLRQVGADWKFLSVPLSLGNNAPTIQQANSDTFSGDGSTLEFTLSETAGSTTYQVFVSGREISSGCTKTTSAITFSTAPRNGVIIEARYNAATVSSLTLTASVHEPDDDPVELEGLEALSISEKIGEIAHETLHGIPTRFETFRSYGANVSFFLEENARKFLDAWSGKTFRLILENDRAWDYRRDILASCEINSGASVDYIEGAYAVPVTATDFYQAVAWEPE